MMSKRAASSPTNSVKVRPETYATILALSEKYEISLQKILDEALQQLYERVVKHGVAAIYEDMEAKGADGKTPTNAPADVPAVPRGAKARPEKADKVCPDGKHCPHPKAVNS